MDEQNQDQKQNSESLVSYNYDPITWETALKDDDYFQKAHDNILRFEEWDKELAQSRTNFQIEKFIMLEQHTIPAAFDNALKSRRKLAEAHFFKLMEMKAKVRAFEYKWGKVEDKSVPLLWNNGASTENGGALCWYEDEHIGLIHYLKGSELQIRDNLYQLQHYDKILEKLIELNGGKPVTRQQFLDNDAKYWERRFADQAMDEMVSSQTGISIGNLHSMRRASAPSLVDDRNEIKDGYLPLSKLLEEGHHGKMEFLSDLQKKVLEGVEETTGFDFGFNRLKGDTEERKKIEGEG